MRYALIGGDIYSRVDPDTGEVHYAAWFVGPAFILLTSPLGWMSRDTAAWVWFWLKVGLALFLWWMCVDFHGDGLAASRRRWVGALTLLCSLQWLNWDLTSGGRILPVVFLTVLALWLYRRNFPVWSAMALALATIAMIAPLFLGLYFLIRRNFRFLITWLAACAVLLALPSLFWGWERNARFLTEFWRFFHLPAIIASPAVGGQVDNYSLPAFWLRLTGVFAADTNYGTNLKILSLDTGTALLGAWLLNAAAALFLAAWFWSGFQKCPESCLLYGSALFVAAIPLLAWLTRPSYLVWLMLPYAALLGYVFQRKTHWRWVAGLLAVSAVLQAMVPTDFWGREFSHLARSWYVLFWHQVVIVAGLLIVLREKPPVLVPSSGDPI